MTGSEVNIGLNGQSLSEHLFASAANQEPVVTQRLTAGEQAPGFELTSWDGRLVSLAGCIDQGNVLLVLNRGFF